MAILIQWLHDERQRQINSFSLILRLGIVRTPFSKPDTKIYSILKERIPSAGAVLASWAVIFCVLNSIKKDFALSKSRSDG